MVKLRILPPKAVTLRIPDTQVIIQSSEERYRGPYQVTPDAAAKILDTKDKLMTADVTVNRIPYSEIHNGNGFAIVIGG